jgi:hypothetical protein
MREEIDTEVEVVRRLWFVENFFTYAEKHYHEIALYFLMRFPDHSKYLAQPGPFQAEDAGVKLIFQWFPSQPEVLASLPLRPSSYKRRCKSCLSRCSMLFTTTSNQPCLTFDLSPAESWFLVRLGLHGS